MDRDRLQRIRNWQSDDFYPALVVRPIAIAVMWVIADWRFLSPNVLTTLANVAKLAAIVLILPDDRTGWWAAMGLLQLGLLFDHLDGTMARYRGQSTSFGLWYDNTSDALLWHGLMFALGWVTFGRTGDPLMLALPLVSAHALLMTGYMKWMVEAERRRRSGPAPAAPPAAPPHRTAADWARWIGKMVLQVYRFEEADLYLWVAVLSLADQLELLMWLLAGSQLARLAVMLVRRGLQARALDRAA
ncbi:MAG: CDP-alcohol phosphatidyltransferase family protein [Deltaproteobacteria bacterium]|nr:MAG: CDP-alcohol phosphatidyltransferase family protein [Deltaproteobacteria bacterium]